MKTKVKSSNPAACQSFGVVGAVAVILQFGVLISSAQTGDFLYSGSEQTINLNSGLYDITAYGAAGGNGGYPPATATPSATEVSVLKWRLNLTS